MIAIIDEIVVTGDWNNIESDDCVHSSSVIKLSFHTKIENLLCGILSQKFQDCGLKIQNSRFEKKSMKMQFQKKYIADSMSH